MHIGKLIDQLRSDLRPDTERGQLVRSAIMTSSLKIGGAGIAFLASLLYARILGPHDFGLYAYVYAWAVLMTVPSSLGLPAYLVREGAKAPHAIRWLKRWADKWMLLTGLIAAIVLASAFFIPSAANARPLFIIAAPIPLLVNLGLIRSSLLQARGRVARGQWPGLIAGPTLALLLLLLIWLISGRILAFEVMGAMVLSGALSLIINEIQLFRTVPKAETGDLHAISIRATLPFMWLGVLYLVNSRADLIMLGSLEGAHAAGIYAVASRAAELIGFFMLSASMVISPRVASLYNENNHELLQRLLTATTRRVLLITAPLALLFLFAASPLLKHLYGFAYATGSVPLQILAAAQVIAVATGPKGAALNMTGNEHLSLLSTGFSVILNIILNSILIPLYGIEGTAFATSISIVAYNILLWHLVRTRLALRTDIAAT